MTFSIQKCSVLAPLLFSIFIIAMFAGIDGDHCKFADDGTFWRSADQIQESVEKILEMEDANESSQN